MTNKNVDMIKTAYGHFKTGNMPAVLEMLSPDVTWGMIGRPHDVPMAGIRNGKQGALDFFKTLGEVQELKDFAPNKFVGDDDTVAVMGHTKWKMHKSGVEGENDWVHVFTIKNGLVTSFRGHQDTGLLAEAYHGR